MTLRSSGNSLSRLLLTSLKLQGRHEIAYIFGQLCSPYSIPSLLSRLRDPVEDDMVRHEAAEALGGIASDGVEPASSSSIITHLQTTKANKDLGERERKAQGLDELLPPGGVLEVLREWAVREDAPLVVKESCQIAIDMWEVSYGTVSCWRSY